MEESISLGEEDIPRAEGIGMAMQTCPPRQSIDASRVDPVPLLDWEKANCILS